MKQLVVARYNESLNWLNGVDINTIVYNKGEDIIYGQDDNRLHSILITKLKNVGREAQTYLFHIVSNYDNLANYTVFVQGNPFDHCIDVYSDIHNIESDYEPLKTNLERKICDIRMHPHHYDAIDMSNDFSRYIGYVPDIIEFWAGANFVVSKNAIHRNPLRYYLELLKWSETDIYVAWKLERMWELIFKGVK